MFGTSLLVSMFAIATAIGVHEFGHAFVAYKLGDPTAKNSGRMTLNPVVHLNPLGLLMLVLVGIGFANPVPINSDNFKRKTMKRDIMLVSLAGAGFNVLTAILCAIVMKFLPLISAKVVLMSIINCNLSFAAFNLLPLPLLDGWQIIKELIPYRHYEAVYKYESMSQYIFLIMILTNAHMILMGPIYNILSSIVSMFM